MIVGAGILPTAPLLVDGVSGARPAAVDRVADAVDAVVDALPAADVAVLLVAAPTPRDSSDGQSHGLFDDATADLTGIGRPDIVLAGSVHRDALEAISRVIQYPMYHGEPLPLALSVLALHLAGHAPVVPIAVPPSADADALIAIGAGIDSALRRLARNGGEQPAGQDLRALVIAAGDLSAGLSERSPLYLIEGAAEWDEQVVRCVDSGRLDGLAALGPEQAARVGALGWAPMMVLHGCLARAKIGMVVRHYSAPRGVGYLVAQGG